MISAENGGVPLNGDGANPDPEVRAAFYAAHCDRLVGELEAARARIAELEAACKALYADAHGDGFDSGPSFVPQGLSQQDRDACNAGSMAAIQLSKIQPSKLQSEGWVEVAAILRRLGGQTT